MRSSRQRAKRYEQGAKCWEQRAKSNKQWAKSIEQQAESNKQRAKTFSNVCSDEKSYWLHRWKWL